MIILGLTGSIGMGKSTTAEMFRKEGIPVHDADESVHALYAGEAVPLIEAEFPGTSANGIVDRRKLGEYVVGKPEAMKRLEKIVHPLVARKRDQFLRQSQEHGAVVVVLDVPLLFETGGDKYCDYVAVVTTSFEEQKKRVLSRPDMTIEKFEKILASQISDDEKRKRADFLIDTSQGMEGAREQVVSILKILRNEGVSHA